MSHGICSMTTFDFVAYDDIHNTGLISGLMKSEYIFTGNYVSQILMIFRLALIIIIIKIPRRIKIR